jgi:hypothetical protein
MEPDFLDPNYWQKRYEASVAEYDVLPRWRWLKRSNLTEKIRAERGCALAEVRAQLAELKRKREGS